MRTDSVNHTNNSTTNLIITNNFRLFVADAYGVAEVHMPALAKSFYLMLLRHHEGVAFDDSFKARRELFDVHYEITHCLMEEVEVHRTLDLTEPPTGDIESMCEVIRTCFSCAVGRKRAQPFLVDRTNPNAVRIALPTDRVVW